MTFKRLAKVRVLRRCGLSCSLFWFISFDLFSKQEADSARRMPPDRHTQEESIQPKPAKDPLAGMAPSQKEAVAILFRTKRRSCPLMPQSTCRSPQGDCGLA